MQHNVWADLKWEKTLVIWGFVCLTTLCHIIRKLTTPRLSSLYMFIDLSISHFARNKERTLPLYVFPYQRLLQIRYRMVQPISFVNKSKFSCKRQCCSRIRKLHSLSSGSRLPLKIPTVVGRSYSWRHAVLWKVWVYCLFYKKNI